MQYIRLVQAGRVDRIIAFNELPTRLLKGITLNPISGLPRHWNSTAVTVESKVEVAKGVYEDRKILCHYILEYKDLNPDKEKWSEITNFAKKACDLTQRLSDHVEDMALPMAPDSHQALSIEPEDIPVITIPVEFQEKIVAPSGEPVSSAAPIVTPPIVKEEPKVDHLADAGKMVEQKIVNKSGAWECEVCGKKFEDGRGRFFHYKTHKKAVAA